MDLETLTIRAPEHLFMYHRRILFHPVRAFQLIVVLSCEFFFQATCGLDSMNGMLKLVKHDACGPSRDRFGVGFLDIGVGGNSSRYVNLMNYSRLRMVCTDSHSFCFPSTLPSFSSKEHERKVAALEVSRSRSNGPVSEESTMDRQWVTNKSCSLDYGMFKLVKGGIVSCSLHSKEDINGVSSIQADSPNQNCHSFCGRSLIDHCRIFWPERISMVTKTGYFDGSSSPNVEIKPNVLDWGQKCLYLPSLAFLTVSNTCNDSILHVYELFSTDFQFYPCNFSELLLRPAKVASICFVYLPRWLGLSSAHLLLQTSSGGFLFQTRGFAIESPYEILPILSLDVSSSGRWTKNVSLFNPFDERLHVKEVTVMMLASLGQVSHHTEVLCSVEKFQGSNDLGVQTFKDQLVVKSSQIGLPLLGIRPHGNWEIGPHRADAVIEIDFLREFEGKILGAFCMQLLRYSQEKPETVMIPLEAELDGKAVYDDLSGSVSAFLEPLAPCDAFETVVVAISLRNGASHMLNVVKNSEVSDTTNFHIKYMKGLLLPGNITKVALITCTQLYVELRDSPPVASNIYRSHKLFMLTNDSSSPQIKIPCQDIIHFCSRQHRNSSSGLEYQSEKVESSYTRPRSLGIGIHSPSEIKVLDIAEADILVLENWKSRGTISGMSVLNDHEVLFPMVEVGGHRSKWITVKNPSHQPVVRQLILNSGEIIDECRGPDGFTQPPSSSQPLSKELYAKNSGHLPLEVRKIRVSGTECGIVGFMVHTSKGYALEPRESTKLLISYQYDFSAALVYRDLELSLDTGILAIPMKASLPQFMFNICTKSVSWMRVKKPSVEVLLVFVTFLVFCWLFSLARASGSQDDLCKSERSSIAASSRKAGKTVLLHHKQGNGKFSVSSQVNSLLRSNGDDKTSMQSSVGRYPDGRGRVPRQGMSAQHVESMLENHKQNNQKERAFSSSLLSKSKAVENSDTIETSQQSNVTVKTGKEKGRKQRKRRGAGSKLTGLFEISSGQSGNSTPSSPLSPVTSVTAKPSRPLSPYMEQNLEATYPFTQKAHRLSEKDHLFGFATEMNILEPKVSEKHCSSSLFFPTLEQPTASRKTTNPVLLPSASFPCPDGHSPNVVLFPFSGFNFCSCSTCSSSWVQAFQPEN
ncbi:uncharacterized protein LOC121247872 [Juglans microcarpa x Juglans regia]|uniref:uncharacterized protein LOC121247872 n=1 Tax=Juglans microcarpa x Juglans regia TaxID=2249226 RepID=UPI001B7E959E|nr:uncharacterized protein LOC121247872 [Juglans microcarpa x Juglans regia]